MHDVFKLAPQEWSRLRALLDEAMTVPPADREAWVDRLDEARHAAFKPRLKRLLAHATDAPGAPPATVARLLHTLPKVETVQFASPRDTTAAPPERAGPYRLIRELGSGGMASVWLAERTDMLQGRQVALKLPHGAWKRAGLAERLAREREILATLEHPNIARLYDAGVGEDGQPYLALEYVQGERIDAWCEHKALDVRERLQLFLQVARAVAYAHAQLVVHRDLKPSNILVNDAGDVKLLDFGIAKLLDQGVAQETELTRQAGCAMTPDYAAPEQILGKPIGTGVDIYALGIVLFELLSGQRPYQLKRGTRAALEEAILQADVPRPSGVAPDAWRRALRGDLDTVVLKALKRDPVDRYATVAALAEDLQRYLENRPVRAQPDRAGYRLRKFVSRHRASVVMTATLIVAIVGGAGLSLWQADAARAEQRRAERTLTLVTSIFRDSDPWQSGRERPDAVQLLKAARSRVDNELAEEPLTRAELLAVLAEALVGLQDEEAAEEAGRAALSLATAAGGPHHAIAVRARLALMESHFFRDDLPAARTQIEAVMRALQAAPQHLAELRVPALALLALLEVDEGHFEAGERTAHAALEVASRTPGRWVVREIELWRAIAVSRQARSDAAGSLEAAKRALDMAAAHYRLTPNHPDFLDTKSRYASSLSTAGRTDEALALMREAVAGRAAVAGPDSRAVAVHLLRLASVEWLAGQDDLAYQTGQRSLELLRRHNPPQSPGIGSMLGLLARIELSRRNPAAAKRLADEALQIAEAQNGGDEAGVDRLRGVRALAVAQLGDAVNGLAELERLTAASARHGAVAEADAWHRLGLAQRLAGWHAAALGSQRRAWALLEAHPQQVRARTEVLAEIDGLTQQGMARN